jgi:Rrf2 family protein
MNLSAKTEYAAIAMMELAAGYRSGEPMRIRKIAETHGIPNRFLVQILLQLKAAGFLSSTRGAAGGYQLLKDPAEVTLLDIVEAVEGQATAPASNVAVDTGVSQVLLAAWSEISEKHRELLAGITLRELVDRVQTDADSMFYI